MCPVKCSPWLGRYLLILTYIIMCARAPVKVGGHWLGSVAGRVQAQGRRRRWRRRRGGLGAVTWSARGASSRGATTRTCFTQFVRESRYLRHSTQFPHTQTPYSRTIILGWNGSVCEVKSIRVCWLFDQCNSTVHLAVQPCEVVRKRVTSERPAPSRSYVDLTRMQWWNVACCYGDVMVLCRPGV